MYELVNVGLIDWFLMGRQDIPVRGAIGVYGENRSGKSTLLDAIQTTMLANDKNALQLNAAANPERKKKNRRNVHSYCLGRVGGANEPPLRDSARSHLVLTYQDSISQAYFSMGLILEARVSDTKEETVARWMATGIRVDTSDLLTPTLDGDVARSWAELEDHLSERCAKEGGELRCYFSPSEQMGDMLHWCSQTGQHGGVDQFRRAFANAVSFETIDDESQFVRTYVLDRDNISIRGLRESMRNYREIADTIRSLLQQVEDLDAILGAARKYAGLIEEKDHRVWMLRRAKVLMGVRDVKKYRRALRHAQHEAARLKHIIADCEQQREDLRKERAGLEQALRTSDVAMELSRLELDIQKRKSELDKVAAPVSQWALAVARAASIPGQTGSGLEFLRETAPAVLPVLNALQRLSGADKIPQWPSDPDAMAHAIDQLPDLDALRRSFTDRADTLLKGLRQTEADELAQRIHAIDRTGSAISAQTSAFMVELENQGFHPKLVCAEIEILAPEWRDAAEAVLARDREAVVLPPDQARRAAAILRANRGDKRFKGCRVVNTTKLAAGHPQPHTLAAILRAKDAMVAAFLIHRVGNVRLVDSETELHAGGRAVTQDCAYCDGLVTEIRQVEERKIGADATGAIRRDLERRLKEIRAEHEATQDSVRSLRDLADRLAPLAAARAADAGIVDVVQAYRDKQKAIAGLQDQRTRLRDHVQPEISGRMDGIDSDMAALALELNGDPQAEDLESRKGVKTLLEEALKAEGNAESGFNQAHPDLLVAWKLYQDAKGKAVYPRALPLWRHEKTRHRGALLPLLRTMEARLATLADDIPRANKEVFAQLFEFRRTSRRTIAFDMNASISGEIVPWAQALRDDIADKDLAQHRARAEEAVKEAQKLLKGNFINMLRDRFERVTCAIDQLNNVLRQHAFHNERYRFQVDSDAEFSSLIELVAAAALDETILLPLFGGAAMEASFHAESLKMVEAILMEDDLDFSRFEDYRSYFRFSLLMTDIETGSVTTFAHRLGVGSGAEKQVPFYVAIGAALASAYHNGVFDKSKPGGLGLALFDEAFMKMDPKNQREVLHFYREIGLQPVLAGPKGGKLFMQKEMDTMVKVARPSNKRMVLTVTHPGAALKHALLTQDPGEWPRDKLERAYAAMQQ